MTAMYYLPPVPMPFNQTGLAHSYSNFFILPTTTAIPYNEGLISPPASYSISTAIQPPTPNSAPARLPSEDMVKIFENFTCSSPPTTPQVNDDIQQSVASSNTVGNSE